MGKGKKGEKVSMEEYVKEGNGDREGMKRERNEKKKGNLRKRRRKLLEGDTRRGAEQCRAERSRAGQCSEV